MTTKPAQAQTWAALGDPVPRNILAAAREAHLGGCTLDDRASCPRCAEFLTAELRGRHLRRRCRVALIRSLA